ncbi:DUF3800 domain-containing protein [Methanobrevibacter filiformis]|uniref:DUF3800 domain-containing protein n=1 Tax=Methanobrevibacter filiformis TaxID=55758 RepID=A0A166A6A6_9EURY|nr:DUF3800 domain-containing protein [Methanobrevibacter filiformis]KZX11628.1 hypothetical protein MBFIL_13510 [Methanobrevibacter filiformis]
MHKHSSDIMKKYSYYLFLDESGDLGLDSEYFVISILMINSEDLKKLENIIKKARKNKLKRKLKNINELKFYKLPPEIKIYFLKELNKLNFKAYSLVTHKKDCKHLFSAKSNKNRNYAEMVIYLLKEINIQKSFDLKIDQCFPSNYIKFIQKEILGDLAKFNEKCNISQNSSEKIRGLQFADLIASSCFQHFDRKNSEFFKIIDKNHIIYKYK